MIVLTTTGYFEYTRSTLEIAPEVTVYPCTLTIRVGLQRSMAVFLKKRGSYIIVIFYMLW